MTTETTNERTLWLHITRNTDIENSFRKTVNKAKQQEETNDNQTIESDLISRVTT